jgi:hypothetical protein
MIDTSGLELSSVAPEPLQKSTRGPEPDNS